MRYIIRVEHPSFGKATIVCQNDAELLESLKRQLLSGHTVTVDPFEPELLDVVCRFPVETKHRLSLRMADSEEWEASITALGISANGASEAEAKQRLADKAGAVVMKAALDSAKPASR